MPFFTSILIRSGDATARIWQIPANPEDTLQDPIVLKHLPALTDNNRDVTAMDWNVRLDSIWTILYPLCKGFWTNIFTLLPLDRLQELYWQQDFMTDRHASGLRRDS